MLFCVLFFYFAYNTFWHRNDRLIANLISTIPFLILNYYQSLEDETRFYLTIIHRFLYQVYKWNCHKPFLYKGLFFIIVRLQNRHSKQNEYSLNDCSRLFSKIKLLKKLRVSKIKYKNYWSCMCVHDFLGGLENKYLNPLGSMVLNSNFIN